MGDHMPSILKQEQVGSVQRLVEISVLAGLDYLILCSNGGSALGSQCLDTKLGIVQQWESRGRFSRVAPYASPLAKFF
jgi:hypothetical protein